MEAAAVSQLLGAGAVCPRGALLPTSFPCLRSRRRPAPADAPVRSNVLPYPATHPTDLRLEASDIGMLWDCCCCWFAEP